MNHFCLIDKQITVALSSILSDNLSNELQTYLRSFLQLSGSSSGANLLTGSNVDISSSFFSQDPNQNFPNQFANISNVLTTSSDFNFIISEDQVVKIIWGRHGSDSLSGFDPGANLADKQKVDVLIGDFIDENLTPQIPALNAGKEWSDRFILGDWQKPYYVEDDKTLGLNQIALIVDFNKIEDSIQLHGNYHDYKLVDTSLGTAIFWEKEQGYDLIGIVGGVSDLSLDSSYFKFQGNTAPLLVQNEAGHIGTPAGDYIFSSTVDAKGNLYVGGGTGGSLGGANQGARDAWLTKYDSKGNQLWSKQFGSPGTESVWAIASDGNNIYVAGNTTNQLEGNISQGGNDGYVAKYDSDGNQLWIKQYGTYTLEESYKLTVDTSGNVYVAGHTFGNLGGENKNQGQGEVFELPSTDAYVVKFDTNGNQLWAQQFGTITLDDNWGIAIDKDGNVFAGGNTKGDFGGKNAGSAREYDAWLVKLDKNGQVNRVQQFGTPDYDFMWDIETDSIGNIYATGWTFGDFGGKNAGSYDTWLAKYDTNGNQLWIKQFGTSGEDAPFLDGIEIDSNDNIFLAGYTDSNLGGSNAGSYDAWAAKYDKDGNQIWIQQFGTPNYDAATTVKADTDGNLYLSGITEGSLGATNVGSYDSWILKLDADKGTIQNFANHVVSGCHT